MTPTDYKTARKLRGTQAAVAALLGVNRVTVARRETGEQVITTEAWLALLALPKKRKRRETYHFSKSVLLGVRGYSP